MHLIEFYCTSLHCTALHCIALDCTAVIQPKLLSAALHWWHCTELCLTALHALHCTALYCTALHCTVWHCAALRSERGVKTDNQKLHSTAQQSTALAGTALHCTALKFIALGAVHKRCHVPKGGGLTNKWFLWRGGEGGKAKRDFVWQVGFRVNQKNCLPL